MKRSERFWLLAALLLITVGLCVGLLRGWNYAPGQDSMESLAVWEQDVLPQTVELRLQSLELRIYAGMGTQLELDANRPASRLLAVTREGDALLVTEMSVSRLERLFSPSRGYAVLWLPDGFRGELRVRTASGDVSLNGLRAPALTVEAESASGALYMYDSRLSRLRAGTASGEIYVGDLLAEQAEFATVSGEQSLRGVRAETLNVSSVSGSVWISLEEPAADWQTELRTVSGRVSAPPSMQGERRLTAETVSGDICLEFYTPRESLYQDLFEEGKTPDAKLFYSLMGTRSSAFPFFYFSLLTNG